MNAPAPTLPVRFWKKILRAVGLETAGRALYHRYRHWRALRVLRISGTSLCRSRLAPYCNGDGVDLGFGGDPITASAIRIDMPAPYGAVGQHPVQLGGDASNLVWFRDNALDYVFSSHLLEDFDDTSAVLREWLRVLKPGGRLVIYCPDEQRYREHCQRTGEFHNPHHKHADFSLAYVKRLLDEIGGIRYIYENPRIDLYSWDLVAEKV
jgi:SAM-dependent methyltransferase